MTSRTPPPQNRAGHAGEIYHARPWNYDPNIEYRDPVNRIQRKPNPDNNSSLFDINRDDYPVNRRADKTETDKPETNQAEGNKQDERYGREPDNNRNDSYSAVERDTKAVDARVDSVNYKIEALNSDYKGVPGSVGEVGTNMASNGYKMDELEMRNKLHSAKIHELERELKNVRFENNAIKGQYNQGQPGNTAPYSQNGTYASPRNAQPYGQNGTYAPQRGNDPGLDPYQHGGAHQDYPGAKEMAQRRAEDLQSRKMYKNEQHHTYNGPGEKDGEAYWGFNKFYSPDYSTAYRREHIPYLTKMEEKGQTTQYASDYNHLQEMYRRQEEEWLRKRQHEEDLQMRMQDKPRTYDYTAPYQALFPPRDINKYFHDSKYMEDRPEPKPDEWYFENQVQAPFRENPGTGLSTYERAFIPPGHPRKTQQQPGGLYIVRFHVSGTDDVNLSLKEQQTIIKSFGGHVLGLAGRGNKSRPEIVALSGDADWRFSKTGEMSDNIAVLWFPSKEKAFDFFSNSFRNRFKQQGFPTPHGWEGHYISMNTPILFMAMNTYLVVEVSNKGRPTGKQTDVVLRQGADIVKARIPNSMPFVAAAEFKDRESFKPGPLFNDRNTAVFISRFSSMNDAIDAWDSGKISEALAAGGFMGPTKASAFRLHDWEEM